MTAATRDFGVLEERVRRFRDEREWRRFHTPKDLAASVAIEAAELLEHFQWRTDEETRADLADPAKRDAVAGEMADVLGIDLLASALRKIDENALKYPVEKARGRSTKYDKL